MSKFLLASLLAIGTLLGASQVQAQTNYRDQIRMIESEYARINNGRIISDNQLEFYLDRSNAGWSMNQISRDMTLSRQAYANREWRPASGWTAREVICSSTDNRYRECQVPFRGTAVITQQISRSACVEGRSWGNKPGAVWVRNGCRARFGIVRTGQNNPVPPGNNRMVVCQSNQDRYRECATGFRGRVELVNRLNNSQACIEGRSWGQREGVVWVRNGCRAQFQSVGRRGPRDDHADPRDDYDDPRNDWRRDDNYSVTCSSIDNRRELCTWDPRYGTPRIVQRISNNNCIEGRDWGYDNRGQLWVDAGCRARFGYR